MPDGGITEAFGALFAGSATAAEIATVVSTVGIGMSVVGVLTGDKGLAKLGAIFGLAGGVASLGMSALSDTAGAATIVDDSFGTTGVAGSAAAGQGLAATPLAEGATQRTINAATNVSPLTVGNAMAGNAAALNTDALTANVGQVVAPNATTAVGSSFDAGLSSAATAPAAGVTGSVGIPSVTGAGTAAAASVGASPVVTNALPSWVSNAGAGAASSAGKPGAGFLNSVWDFAKTDPGSRLIGSALSGLQQSSLQTAYMKNAQAQTAIAQTQQANISQVPILTAKPAAANAAPWAPTKPIGSTGAVLGGK